ncbi:MAG TPA: phytoene/squalene synthase family protein [Actinomycetes bacterium]|nr:phytoene/squalene synthase family protein [Actinomycetes bacterium]
MSGRDLDAAGITDAGLRAAYEECRRLNARHGKTYYLATLLLPREKRPYVHALYGFARYADEIVDAPETGQDPAARLDELTKAFHEAVGSPRVNEHPVLRAVVDTIRRWDIDVSHVEDFLASMAMDLTVGEYQTYDDLMGYVHGSASVIGEQMVPILEPLDAARAAPYARDLGTAFQLANFIRDVGEDLDRGRVYLPLEDLARFGLNRADLEQRVVDERVRDLLRFEIARVRRLALAADPGIALLHPTSRPCIEAARVLYCGIVDEVERIDFQVFDRRASVPLRRRLAVAGRAYVRGRAARRSTPPEHPPRQRLQDE